MEKVIAEMSLPPALPRLASCVFISAYSLIGLFMDRGIHAHSSPSSTVGFCICVFVERLLRASLAQMHLPLSLLLSQGWPLCLRLSRLLPHGAFVSASGSTIGRGRDRAASDGGPLQGGRLWFR